MASADAVSRCVSSLVSQTSTAGQPPAALLAPSDACLDAVAAGELEPERRQALLGLTDLRRGLFPNAPPYQASGSAIGEPGMAA